MKKILWPVLVPAFFLFSCGNESDRSKGEEKTAVNTAENSQRRSDVDIKVVRYEDLLKYFETSQAPIKVVNFWATWCVPCVKELPYFFEVKNNPEYKEVEWIFVSLDEARLLDEKVKRFVLDKRYEEATHFLLDDNGRQQTWIDVINSAWEGSIPATAIYDESGRQLDFHEGIFTQDELTGFINKNME